MLKNGTQLKSDYLTLAITSICNYRCPYCVTEGMGEAQFSKQRNMASTFAEHIINVTYELGVRRFRLSGGEPTLHKEFGKIVKSILKYHDAKVIVDTNASYLKNIEDFLSTKSNQLKFVVSIDSLTVEGNNFHSGIKSNLNKVIKNIKKLKESNLLKRINMVITNKNYHELDNMVEFCKNLGVPLKLSDVAVRRNQLMEHKSLFQDVEDVKENITENGGYKFTPSFDYSAKFGAPCESFEYNDVIVKIKESSKTPVYNKLVCNTCVFYPCNEGLYFVTVLPDGTLSGCQMNGFTKKIVDSDFRNLHQSSPTKESLKSVKKLIQSMYLVIEDGKRHFF